MLAVTHQTETACGEYFKVEASVWVDCCLRWQQTCTHTHSCALEYIFLQARCWHALVLKSTPSSSSLASRAECLHLSAGDGR